MDFHTFYFSSRIFKQNHLKECVVMKCAYHPDREGGNTCSKCGAWLCDDCRLDVDNRIVCKNCVAEALRAGPAPIPAPAPLPAAYHTEYRPPRRKISGFLVFVFSCLPGANFMYMGLMKRGLVTMSTFFLLCFLTSVLDTLDWMLPGGMILTAGAMALLWFASFFDGFHKRRQLNDGIHVPDDVEGYLGFLSRYKKPILAVAITVVVLSALQGASQMFSYMDGHFLRPMFKRYGGYVPVLAIIVGGSLLAHHFARRKRPPATRDDGGNQ
jgi:hypothetical protein